MTKHSLDKESYDTCSIVTFNEGMTFYGRYLAFYERTMQAFHEGSNVNIMRNHVRLSVCLTMYEEIS